MKWKKVGNQKKYEMEKIWKSKKKKQEIKKKLET